MGMTATSSAPDFSNLDSNQMHAYGVSSSNTTPRRETVMVDVNLLITSTYQALFW